jgi:hypothetical protein
MWTKVPYKKTIVCLANSIKDNGRCIAGREVLANRYGGWIRPVSDRATAELSLAEYGIGTINAPSFWTSLKSPC